VHLDPLSSTQLRLWVTWSFFLSLTGNNLIDNAHNAQRPDHITFGLHCSESLSFPNLVILSVINISSLSKEISSPIPDFRTADLHPFPHVPSLPTIPLSASQILFYSSHLDNFDHSLFLSAILDLNCRQF